MLIQLEQDGNQLTPREFELLKLFRERGSLTLDDIGEAFGMTRGSASVTLTRFTKKVNVTSDRSEWRAPAIYRLATKARQPAGV